MSMDGLYSAMSQEGGAVMSMDGLYSAMSQEGGAVMYRMYRMYGLKIAPAFSALPTSVWVVFHKERRMSMDGVNAIGLKKPGGLCIVFINS
jgi:hypothetical protein